MVWQNSILWPLLIGQEYPPDPNWNNQNSSLIILALRQKRLSLWRWLHFHSMEKWRESVSRKNVANNREELVTLMGSWWLDPGPSEALVHSLRYYLDFCDFKNSPCLNQVELSFYHLQKDFLTNPKDQSQKHILLCITLEQKGNNEIDYCIK